MSILLYVHFVICPFYVGMTRPVSMTSGSKLFLCVRLNSVSHIFCRLCLKCDGTRAETRFRLSAKRTSPFKSAGALVQSTTGSRRVCFSSSNPGYTMFRGSVKSTGYLLYSPVSPSLPLQCVTVCHHISTGLYLYMPMVFAVCHCSFIQMRSLSSL